MTDKQLIVALVLSTILICSIPFISEKLESKWDEEDDPKNWDWHR